MEDSYPGIYDEDTYDPGYEWSGQCIIVARISLSNLDKHAGKAKRLAGGRGCLLRTSSPKGVSTCRNMLLNSTGMKVIIK